MVSDFLNIKKRLLNNIHKNFYKKGSDYWDYVGKKMALGLFKAMSKRVPAYKDFLKRNKINPEKIKTFKDLSYVPTINKNNYLRYYPFDKLVWDGNMNNPSTIHSTSGSTGEPTYFQREFKNDLAREFIIERFFMQNSLTLKGPTLFIITFGMGVWSAGMGMYTGAYLACNYNNFPISIISPGVNKVEVIKIFKKIARSFKQIIIAGYPPFVKDIIDEVLEEGLDLKKMNLRFVFTGESFPEEFRDYLMEKAYIRNVFTDTMNTYGTSEVGPTGVETPLTIFIKRMAYKNNYLFEDIFGKKECMPTLVQYVPYFVNLESLNGEILFTVNSRIPLVRYQSGDKGGVLLFDNVEKILDRNGINLMKEVKKLGIDKYISKLPFVYIYERKDLAATLYGILIYPEFIKKALFNNKISRFLTGKFTMITRYNSKRNQYLEINLELKRSFNKIKSEDKKNVLKIIVDTLRKNSSEYRELSNNIKSRAYPKLLFWPYQYPKYFLFANKQKWVEKEKK
jgi:phenylacetate-CoA ligase